jgi:hypothetical protein
MGILHGFKFYMIEMNTQSNLDLKEFPFIILILILIIIIIIKIKRKKVN